MYDATRFRKTFRMAHPLFNQIVNEVTNHDAFFRNNIECTGRESIFALLKCTSVIRQLAYGVNADFLDEYIQISEGTSRTALGYFCQPIMKIYRPEYLRKPTVTDIEKLYLDHKEKHGFSGMLGSLDCTDYEWFGCPYGFKGQYVRRDHGLNPFILLEVVASQDLCKTYGYVMLSLVLLGRTTTSMFYINPVYLTIPKNGRAPEIPFVANGVTYQ
uniref:Uncharacterized protein n=1 Tax=Tanacetum cinerariifolium TaxID=118510 RepID=A0A6L2NQX5_TANCI|nr:hypothetical protein [Tanacetum cinerariifolium]